VNEEIVKIMGKALHRDDGGTLRKGGMIVRISGIG
jgi:hypothetical protein